MLVDELARAGLRHVVIAPGSRSTPLTLAFAAHPDVEDHSVIDERSAAFFALGLALATEDPVAVVTTSGTATANLYPAVMEAEHAGVPLLLMTADRPARLRDTGESQAADQIKMFGERVRWFHEVDRAEASERALAYLRSTADHALARARGIGCRSGPVHLNVPLDKPLEPTPANAGQPGALSQTFDPSTSLAAQGRAHGGAWTRHLSGESAVGSEEVERLALDLASARRPLILVGATTVGEGRSWRQPLANLLRQITVPVWAECLSQLRLDPDRCETVFPAADLMLGSDAFRSRLDAEPPDLVVRLGEAPIGWPLRRWVTRISENPETRMISIAADGRRRDPEHAISALITASPGALLNALAAHMASDRPTRPPIRTDETWLELNRLASSEAEAAVRSIGEPGETADRDRWDGRTFFELGRVLPEDAALVVSSSLPLRDIESFLLTTDHDVDLFANRGLNGIDGVTSTALGIAQARRVTGLRDGSSTDQGTSRTLLAIGDVALAHDLSGLAMAARLSSDLTIVVIDNGGGAIFDFLPLAKSDESPTFERHFTTPPGLDLSAFCRALGIEYSAPETWSQFRQAVTDSIDTAGPRLIRVETDRERSSARRTEILERIAGRIDRALAGQLQRTSPLREASVTTEPAQTPIVLLHGFTGSATSWDDFRDFLDDRHPVVALDLPGHGLFPEPADLGVADLAHWLIDQIDRRGVDCCHLVGYSMGGRVALATALVHPDRVRSLCLIGAGAGIEDERERELRHRSDGELADRIEAEGLAKFVDDWMKLPIFASQARLGHRGLRKQKRQRLQQQSSSIAESLRNAGQGDQPSYRDAVNRVAKPCLLIAGADDETYVGVTRELGELIAEARVEIVPESGHAPQIEQPQATAELIATFVAASALSDC